MSQLTLFSEWEAKDNVPDFSNRKIIQASFKPVGEEVREVIELIKEAYLDVNNNRVWVIASSMGKDSTLLCLCIWIALLEIPAEKRTRQVHIISSDTGLENPGLKSFVHESIKKMNESAFAQGLDCLHAHIVMPDQKNRFAAKVIAHGVPLSTPKSPFRWCTDAFKISPTEIFIKSLLAEFGEVVIFTGVRVDESAKRAASIKKNGAEEFIFQKYRSKKDNNGQEERKPMKGRFESHPIKSITDEVLWQTLMNFSPKFPWNMRFLRLYALYKDTGECPMQVGEMKQSCGTSRNGCVICLFVKEDNMLKYFVDRGEEWAEPIIKLRTIMKLSVYDGNFREPLRKKRIKSLDTFDVLTGQHESDGQITLLDMKSMDRGQEDTNPYESLCIGGKPVNPDLALASFTLEARIFLLKNTLYYQNEAGIELVNKEDIEYIKSVWKLEMGWIENENDFIPEAVPYYGSMVLNKEYQLNESETSIPNLVVDTRYYAFEELIQNNNKSDLIAEVDYSKIENLKVLNATDDYTKENLNFIYYITTDFGGGEEEIYDCLSRSKVNTRINIPYYWEPIVTKEFGRNVFWNNVTFIVSRPEIKSLAAARTFVGEYINAGTVKPPEEVYDFERHYWQLISGKTPFDAKRVIIQAGFHHSQLPQGVKEYTGITDEEIEVAYVIKCSIGDGFSPMTPEKAFEACQNNLSWDEVFWTLLYELRTPELVKGFLIEKGYIPQVVPEAIKFYAEISDLDLYFGNKVRVNGMRDVLSSLLFLPDQYYKLPEFIKAEMKNLLSELRCQSVATGT